MVELQAPQRPPAWLLDLTRLTSRVGRGPMTGIDRVEAAYLRQLLAEDTPIFGLVRTSLGFSLLDRTGVTALRDRITGDTNWGKPDLISRLFLKSGKTRRTVESDLRRLCIQRATPKGLPHMLVRTLPKGVVWLNVGHTNLNPAVFDAIHQVENGRAHVMVHDVIPLIYPQYQRVGTVDVFSKRMQSISENADLVIYNSYQSQKDAEPFFKKWGRIPEGLVAHLGIERPIPDPTNLPPNLNLSQPYFVTVGTIEPRKNHAFLLDVWQQMSTENLPLPQLIIIGNRGWNNEALFKRLDASPDGIIELNGLNDAAMAALVQGACASLFPSLAEGFGLPPGEAILLGTPVITTDLAVTREILNNIPIYANALDMYSWAQIIRELIAKTKTEQSIKGSTEKIQSLPTWHDHFNMVLTMS